MSTLSISSPGLSYSDETYLLQQNLKTLGFTLEVDGLFGSETQQAVKNFQYTWGIAVDGIAGSDTQQAIQAALSLLANGQWNVNLDPTSAPSTIQTGEAPQIISPLLAKIDTKWLLIGAGIIAFLLFGGKLGRKD